MLALRCGVEGAISHRSIVETSPAAVTLKCERAIPTTVASLGRTAFHIG